MGGLEEGARTACFTQGAWEEGWEEAGKMAEEVEEAEAVGQAAEDSWAWVQDKTTRRPEEC